MFNRFVGIDKAELFAEKTGSKPAGYLLWGDGVEVLQTSSKRSRVRARGTTGWVDNDAIDGQSLLEFYFIDVGQGDGVLIKTPDFRHILIDAGFPRAKQPARKNAADFVDWKFFRDYGKNLIELEVMMTSHNDEDHYGGLSDLLDVAHVAELNCTGVRVDAFYHAGLSWWLENQRRTLGPSATMNGSNFYTQLLSDRASILAALEPGARPQLQGAWRNLMQHVSQTKRISGGATRVVRLSNKSEFVPKFESDSSDVAVHVLAPVEFTIGNKPAIRKFSGGESINTNGNSLLLRVDYGRSRTLLTGDLNSAAMRSLLSDYTGQRLVFACDVAKACHHGSDDVSYEFLQTLAPSVTVISSGDNEGHDHPRPSIIAASATTGFLKIQDDKIISPLIYSTELARSYILDGASGFDELDEHGKVVQSIKGEKLKRSRMKLEKQKYPVPLRSLRMVGNLIYGLVNVRTDGDKILCATRSEQADGWKIKTISSRF